jgi:hypothetical protein
MIEFIKKSGIMGAANSIIGVETCVLEHMVKYIIAQREDAARKASAASAATAAAAQTGGAIVRERAHAAESAAAAAAAAVDRITRSGEWKDLQIRSLQLELARNASSSKVPLRQESRLPRLSKTNDRKSLL